MNKYVQLIVLLLTMIFAAITYVGFVTLAHEDITPGAPRDVIIIFNKETHTFEPDVVTVKEGDIVSIKFINKDIYSHGLALDMFRVAMEAAPDSAILLPPFTASRTGSFIFYCPSFGRTHLSEVGTLIVQPIDK